MFESEDFDLDEDFLEDIGKKEEEYYSQKIESQSNQETKRRKTEPIETDFLSDITFDDEPDFARITTRSVKPSLDIGANTDLSSRDKITPVNFETADDEASNNQNEQKIYDIDENTLKNSRILSNSESNENMEISRKTMALEILRKGSESWDKSRPEKISSTSRTIRTTPLRPISSDGERNSRIVDTNEQARRKSLLETFKKPIARSTKSPAKFGEKTSPKFSSKDRSIAAAPPRVTVVRKFPGPAGLLPDCPETIVDTKIFFNHLDDCKIETNDDHDDSGISEYFSQNTERLFSVGAWRLMLDDLPKDFLRGHEIATIKRTARNNSRVRFLAGVIQRIDHSVENPRLVLKDLSDTIEGTMHRDIPLAYPNILEPGVVVLLRNAGVLGFQESPNFPSLQFHVMIAPTNIIAVYSEKSRLVTSPWMESLVGTLDSVRATARTDENTKSSSRDEIEETRVESIETSRKSMTTESNIDLSDFDNDEEDGRAFDRFNIDEIVNSQVSANLSKISSNWDDKTSMTDVSPEIGERKRKICISEAVETSTRVTNEIFAKPSRTIDEKLDENTTKCSSVIDIDIVRPKKIESTRSKLLQFRSKDVMTPKICEQSNVTSSLLEKKNDIPMEEGSKEENSTKTRGFGDDLMDSDNDTDDEILSQLDVDSIVTSYNSAI